MTATEIDELLRARPFRPFRVHLSDGGHYDIPHPELAGLTRRTLVVFVGPFRRQFIANEMKICDLLHITRLEILPEDEGAQAS